MKRIFILLIGCCLSISLVTAQQQERPPFVDHKFFRTAKAIFKQEESHIRRGDLRYPCPWDEDSLETRNLRSNKVKEIRNAFFTSTYNPQGKRTRAETYFRTQFRYPQEQPGSANEFVWNGAGNLIMSRSNDVSTTGEVHERTYFSAGDTVYVRWTVNNNLRGLALCYENMYVDLNVANGEMSTFIYEMSADRDGYKVKQLVRQAGRKKFEEWNTYYFDAANRWTGYSSGGRKEKYFYNDEGLMIEKQSFDRYTLLHKSFFIRNEKGLVEVYVEQTAPFDRRGNPILEKRFAYDYDFYE